MDKPAQERCLRIKTSRRPIRGREKESSQHLRQTRQKNIRRRMSLRPGEPGDKPVTIKAESRGPRAGR